MDEKILVKGSCETCSATEVLLNREAAEHLLVSDCPNCLHRKTFTPVEIVKPAK